MNAPIPQSTFSTELGDPTIITVTLWRGAMIDRFSRAEDAVLLCLRAMRNFELPLPSEAFHEGAKARLRALILTLENQDFGGAGKGALKSLKALLQLNDTRTSLAHGKFRLRPGNLEIEWVHPIKGGGLEWKRRSPRLLDLIEELYALDALQRALGSQLGHIRKELAVRARRA